MAQLTAQKQTDLLLTCAQFGMQLAHIDCSRYWYGGFLRDCQTVKINVCQFFSYTKAIHPFFVLQNFTNLRQQLSLVN